MDKNAPETSAAVRTPRRQLLDNNENPLVFVLNGL